MAPLLHVVSDDSILARDGWAAQAASVLEAGGASIALHVRGPSTDGATLFELTAQLIPEARRRGAWIIVNDRVDVALTAGADGAHLGERSLSAPHARELLGPERRVGVSLHRPAQVERARAEGADYAFVGTIFPTPSHERLPGMGIGGFREAVELAGGLPLFGIGGIGVEQVAPLMEAGARGVAVMRGVWGRPSPAAAVVEYLHTIGEGIDE